MKAISVDVASRRYRDMGIAVVERRGDGVFASLHDPESLGLRGSPDPEALADALRELGERVGAAGVMLDGPQGWKSPSSAPAHCRVCEKKLATPGKTGVPREVKPPSMARYVEFSIDVFDALHRRRWPRFGAPVESADGVAAESFPTAAWRSLGLPALPSKRRATRSDVRDRLSMLSRRLDVAVGGEPDHDELQAVVAGLAGLGMMNDPDIGARAVGRTPRLQGEVWVEGFIVSPVSAGG